MSKIPVISKVLLVAAAVITAAAVVFAVAQRREAEAQRRLAEQRLKAATRTADQLVENLKLKLGETGNHRLAPYEISLLLARARATAAPGDPDRQVDVVKGLYDVSTAADVPRARAALDEAIALAEALARDGKLASPQQDWPKLLRDALAKLPPS